MDREEDAGPAPTTLVSVIMPARNRVPLLERALVSALRQAGVKPEVVVVDDASDPPLVRLLNPTLRDQVRILTNPMRRNAAYSRNAGAAAASSDILAFLDSDDVWRHDHLQVALRCLQVGGPNCLYITPLRRRSGGARRIEDPYAQRFGGGLDYRTSGFVCRRPLFDAIGGFDPQLEKHQDWDVALRATEHHDLLLGSEATVMFDSDAANRMSGRPNLEATARFLSKHRARMEMEQVAYLIGHLVRSAAKCGDKAVLKQSMQMAKDFVEPAALPPKARLAWHFPRLVAVLSRLRRRGGRLARRAGPVDV